jgi:hypothetical protein
MVSGCVGFLRDFALAFGSSPVGTASFVRKVSRIFQVVGTMPLLLLACGRLHLDVRPHPS